MAFAFVQGVKNENLLPIAVGITATLGNVIVVFASSNDPAATLTISDTQGNVWTASAATVNAAGTSVRMWWAIAKNSLATTITIGGASSNGSIVAAEYSGNDASAGAGDGGTGTSGTNNGATDNISTGNVNTGTAGDLIVGACNNTNSLTAFNPGTGETNRPTASFLSSTFGIIMLQDKIQGSPGNIASTWTLASNADTYIAFEQAIKPLAAGDTLFAQAVL